MCRWGVGAMYVGVGSGERKGEKPGVETHTSARIKNIKQNKAATFLQVR